MAARLEETIKNFYEKNHINSELYTDSMEEAYISNKRYDKKIALPSLQKRVEAWIRFFEKEDQEYFLQLLEGFTYITKETLAYRIYNLCSSLFKNLLEKGIDYSEILFVVIESPEGIKSGADEMAVNIWNINQEFEITKRQIITAYSKVDQKLVEEARAIIFLDDIAATGFTMCGQVNAFFKRFEALCDDSKVYYYTSVLAARNAINYLRKHLEGRAAAAQPFYQEEQIIRSAFRGGYIFGGEIVKEVEQMVQKYEDLIDAYEREHPEKTFSMGFRQCKLLLAFHYETPNNTLCSFWKATDKNQPVFVRSGYSRLSLDRIRKQKIHMRENAYLYQSIHQGGNK